VTAVLDLSEARTRFIAHVPRAPSASDRTSRATCEGAREGFVIRNLGGQAKTNENQIKNMMYRVCRLAGLPERGWHTLRHSFGTHAAIFGVNPWRLMTWMGHKRIDETMRYVHVASAHMRDLPKELLDAASSEHDPDRRVLIMLGARGSLVRSWQPDGNTGSPFLKVAGT